MLARLGVCVPLVLLGALALTGCGEPAQDSSSALRARAEPYFREFEEFDAWARRNFDADLALRDAVGLLTSVPRPSTRELAALSEAWRPHRSFAAVHLWTWLREFRSPG